tara:strand:- start:758 stop:979 length:222 start_codon:yes stop_codon:yes gene_type:complete
MKFWHQSFPDKIYNLKCDDLIKNQEIETRGLLKHIDLYFNYSCLDFHKTERLIEKASAMQVRQKCIKKDQIVG